MTFLIWRLHRAHAIVAAVVILASEWSTVSGSPAQTFYPNGRYGKRQLSPAQMDNLIGQPSK